MPQQRRAERILTGIFDHVAQSVAFAERKIAAGKMPRARESAVLGSEDLLRLLDDHKDLLDEAIKRHYGASSSLLIETQQKQGD